MKTNDLGSLFLRHLVIAIPWGIIFLIIIAIASYCLKQQVKEGIQYTFSTAIDETLNAAYRYQTVMPVKQNVKEGIEFAGSTVAREIRTLLQDPQVKQDLKEIFEAAPKKSR